MNTTPNNRAVPGMSEQLRNYLTRLEDQVKNQGKQIIAMDKEKSALEQRLSRVEKLVR